MNSKEIAELRAQIKPDSKNMYIPRIAAAYIVVNNEGAKVKTLQLHHLEDLPEEEQNLYCRMLKKALGGKMGKNLMEYSFVKDENNQSPFQIRLMELVKSRLDDEALIRQFADQFAAGAGILSSCLLTLAFCEYSVPVKDKNDEINVAAAGTKHCFILGAVNEVTLTDIGLFFNEEENVMEKKVDIDMHVLPAVIDGFMYPTFTDRSTDVNSILYYTKTPKKPNEMLIENILGAAPALSPDQEQLAFKKFLDDVAQENLSLDLISHLRGSIRDMISENEEEELAAVSRSQMKTLLLDSGLKENQMTLFNAAYDQHIGQADLKACNIVDPNKMSVKMADIVVTVKGDAAYKVKTQMIDGRQYLVIAMDDGLQVDGMDVTK